MSARGIFVGGTSSHAGKSWMATAICRYLKRRGVRVAPFKAQNMSNNSYPCVDAGEIGRAQVAQAEACELAPEAAFNPILLKPCGDSMSQVVLHGKVWRTLHAREYYEHFDFLLGEVMGVYEALASRFDVIVIEGAGSVAELNLRSRDLVNMGLAQRVGARALLVADIERGGVFASVLGTLDLLGPEERALVRAFAVNRFRGDAALFEDGVRILEGRSGLGCLGVFPYADQIHVDDEDSVSLAERAGHSVAIVKLPRVSNFTDFRLLTDAAWVTSPVRQLFDVVILPGTKETVADLHWMRERGLDEWVLRQHRAGAKVIGICGGYQMLGRWIDDEPGLGLLPVRTVMREGKTTLAVHGQSSGGALFDAYEIHMGETEVEDAIEPFATLDDGRAEGVRAGNVIGTYLHGAFENANVLREMTGIEAAPPRPRLEDYDRLAEWFTKYGDMSLFEREFVG